MNAEIAAGDGIGTALLFGGLCVQHAADDLVGDQKALGRQMPAAVFKDRIAGLAALLQKGEEPGVEPAA